MPVKPLRKERPDPTPSPQKRTNVILDIRGCKDFFTQRDEAVEIKIGDQVAVIRLLQVRGHDTGEKDENGNRMKNYSAKLAILAPPSIVVGRVKVWPTRALHEQDEEHQAKIEAESRQG